MIFHRRSVWVISGLVSGLVLAGWTYLDRTGMTEPRDLPFETLAAGETPKRIVAFGTSLTQGNRWPERLAMGLSECFGHPVEVLRVAGPGQGSTWALDHVGQVIALDPDVVLMEFAINDADLRDGVGRAVSRRQHAALVDALVAGLPEARIALMTMSGATGARGLMRPLLAAYYADVATLAKQRGLALFDFYPRWRASGLDAHDGLHPDDTATAQVMDQVLQAGFVAGTGQVCRGRS
jgi:lysophospholipase L1-like esterase